MKNKGITLISLVVTIIILIILAGVSINLVLGDNGIITKAKIAKAKTANAEVEEDTILKNVTNEMEGHILGTRENKASYQVIFNGTANMANEEYTLNDSIEKYDFIEVYAKSYDPGSSTRICFSQEQRIKVSDINYEEDTPYAYRVGFYQGDSTNFGIAFKFTSNNKLYLHQIDQSYCTNAQIYEIIGYCY